MRALSIGVLGCGTAGSAAAVFLARAGHDVTVYERVEDPRPVGAGITLQPTGIQVLRRLGIKEDVGARGARIDRLHCVTDARKTLVDLSYRDVEPRFYGIGIHRGALFQSLFHAVETCGARLVLGVAGEDLERAEAPLVSLPGAPSRERARLYWVLDAEGRRHGPHELVVVADGSRSRFRDDTDLDKRVTPYPWGALWFVAKDPTRVYKHTLLQVVRKNKQMVGFLPTGVGPTGMTPLVSLFWSLRADRLEAWRAAGLRAWRDDVLALAPEAAPLLAQISSLDEVLFAGYFDVEMTRWSTRSVVYLGDAAHATSPQLGQGANLALWDAMVLSDCLKGALDLPRALDAYSRARRSHLAYYQLATRWLTPFFQGDAEWLGTLRDLAMPIASSVGLTNRIMTWTMAGVVDGFTGRRLSV